MEAGSRLAKIGVILLAIFLLCLAGSGFAGKTTVDTKPQKVSSDSTVKAVDPDEVQRIADDYDRRLAQLENRITQLESEVRSLKAQVQK